VEQHPDKTFIGRIERGFTFLGYWITEKGVTGVAPSTWEAFQERVARLYEQNAPQEECLWRIGQYVRRWQQWVISGVRGRRPLGGAPALSYLAVPFVSGRVEEYRFIKIKPPLSGWPCTANLLVANVISQVRNNVRRPISMPLPSPMCRCTLSFAHDARHDRGSRRFR
jgi:hypothetical protein